MNSPFTAVKNTRKSYSKFKGEVYTEVEVQFKDEDPAWIPLDTLLAIQGFDSSNSFVSDQSIS